MSKLQITLNNQVDRAVIDADIALDGFAIAVINSFYPEGLATVTIDAADFDGTLLEALKKVVDKAVFSLEENAYVWKIERVSKTFNLNDSFIRDVLSTEPILTKIPDGEPIKARFEIPGFASDNFREIDVWIAEDFAPGDLALLAEIGITITGDGGYFTITNSVECKVSFYKPVSAIVGYVIVDPNAQTVIAP